MLHTDPTDSTTSSYTPSDAATCKKASTLPCDSSYLFSRLRRYSSRVPSCQRTNFFFPELEFIILISLYKILAKRFGSLLLNANEFNGR